eukprot:2366399-Amphidinium_carterae.2
MTSTTSIKTYNAGAETGCGYRINLPHSALCATEFGRYTRLQEAMTLWEFSPNLRMVDAAN